MCTRTEYINLILSKAADLQQLFNITSLSIFGSVAREEQKEGSDVDIFVTMPPRIYLVIGAQQYLEELLGCKVDIVRDHPSLNPYLRQQIEQDGICIFSAA